MLHRVRSRRLLGCAAALVTSLTLVVTMSGFTAGASSGAGVMTVSPNIAAPGDTGQTFTFDFYNDELLVFAGSSQVTLLVPSGWTNPTGHILVQEGAGFLGNTCNPGATSISGNSGSGWTITIPMTCGFYDHLTITYSGVTVPATTGTFTTRSRNGTGAFGDITTSPVITVKQAQTITFAPLPDQVYGAGTINLTATASSNLTVAYSATGNCTVSGHTLTITGAGSCSVTASQAGNANWAPAPNVTQGFAIGKASQTITFAALPNTTLSSSPINLTATASSGSTVTFSAGGNCTVSGHTLTLTAVGSCSVTASQGGNANWAPAPDVIRSFTIGQGSQTITFGALSDRTYGDGTVNLTATASSGLAVSYSATGNCTVSGHTLTITGAGSCSVTASQAGNGNWTPAPTVTRSFNIAKAWQIIIFLPLPDRTYGHAPIILNAFSTSGLPITYTTSGSCSVSGDLLTITGAGSCSVTASQPGDANYDAAFPWTWSFDIAKASQTVTFAALPDVAFSNATITLTATASSGLPVTYGASGACTVSGNTLTLTGVGTCAVTASQAGNGDYLPAPSVPRTFNITQGSQTITFGSLPDKVLGDVPIDLTTAATASSGLAVTYGATGECSVSGNTLTLTGVGTCTVTASQAGDANWKPATDKSQTFSIDKTGQTITFAALPDMTYGDGPVDLHATASSGLDVSFVAEGQCSLTGASLTISAAGTCSVTASQDGNGVTGPAKSVSWVFTIDKHVLTVTAADKTRPVGAANPTLTATTIGLVNGDTSAVVTGVPGLSTAADGTSPVGAYSIVADCSTLTATNYSFDCVDGTLTVTLRLTLTVKANDLSRDYGDPNPTLTVQISGYADGDDDSDVTSPPKCTTTAKTDSDPGFYPITCSGAASDKYDFTYVAGQLTITGTSVGGESATPVRPATPPVTSGDTTLPTGDSAPLIVLVLICLAFSGLGLLAVQVQRRAIRN